MCGDTFPTFIFQIERMASMSRIEEQGEHLANLDAWYGQIN